MLAAVYVLRLEDLAADRHAAVIAEQLGAALGGQPRPVPTWDETVAAFNTDLAEPPPEYRAMDRSTRGIRLRALGVA